MARSTVFKKELVALGLLSLSALAGCSTKSPASKEAEKTWVGQLSAFNVNLNPMNKLVCDPLGTPESQLNSGIVATLFQTSANQNFMKVQDYMNLGKKSEKKIFLSTLNVPTRMFSTGFATENGETIKNEAGQTLIEYFGLKFETDLQLDPDQPEGEYEFAFLSDDGLLAKARDGAEYVTFAGDGNHTPTKMNCSTRTFNLKHGDQLPVEIQYFQGPRYHIALVALMRKVQPNQKKDPLCNQAGNELFFNPNKNSVPLKPYQDLLSRGWQPLKSTNYALPNFQTYNPCVAVQGPEISQFKLDSKQVGEATFSWQTDVVGTSQLLITNVSTGESFMTEADNRLDLNHQVKVTGIHSHTLYQAKAISIGKDMGRGVSEPLDFGIFAE